MSEILIKEYSEITGERADEAAKLHAQIMANGQVAASALLEFCKGLKRMRDEKLYTELGFDTFEDYTEKLAGIKSRMAYHYISCYENLGTTFLQSNANLGITKLIASPLREWDRLLTLLKIHLHPIQCLTIFPIPEAANLLHPLPLYRFPAAVQTAILWFT